MLDATPLKPSTKRCETEEIIAKSIYKFRCVRLGRFIVEVSQQYWNVELIFNDVLPEEKPNVKSDRSFETTIPADGIHYAAKEIFNAWVNAY